MQTLETGSLVDRRLHPPGNSSAQRDRFCAALICFCLCCPQVCFTIDSFRCFSFTEFCVDERDIHHACVCSVNDIGCLFHDKE